ncbi:MAG: hypothetical protein G01um10148_26 [Parcubacteria group bacterium Gr01-1014_8]|nr:MAG: hypothetical protein G01um10148_26 [Parcubacteria group bacterium Gr01-1014_8]
MKNESGMDRRRFTIGAALAMLGITGRPEAVEASEITKEALEYLRLRGFTVAGKGATISIFDNDGRVVSDGPTPRNIFSGNVERFHKIKLLNMPKTCDPFLVGTLGAMSYILVPPKKEGQKFAKTGGHHTIVFFEEAGLLGLTGNGRLAFKLDEKTGTEEQITDPRVLDFLQREYSGRGTPASKMTERQNEMENLTNCSLAPSIS